MKKALRLLIIFCLGLFLNNNVLALDNTSTTPSQNSYYKSHDYVIDSYDVNIKVNENNTFDITETIKAYFNVEKHGIYRTIPLTNNITRLDGTTSTNHAKITNLKVDKAYTTSIEDGMYKIKIGSANKTLTGEQTYIISYNYNIGKDPLDNADEFYYNIIGPYWDTFIGNITFTITMPKDFDSSKLGFSVGAISSIDNNQIKYKINKNVITGQYDNILPTYNGLTVRLSLEEDYFSNEISTFDLLIFIYMLEPIKYMLIPISFLLVAFIIWSIKGKDKKIIEPIEFYPPENFNSAEIGLLYKGKADSKDVVSLLIYLANKGYIKISESENGFVMYKIRDYDGTNLKERIFLNGLFGPSDNISDIGINDYISNSKVPETIVNKNNVLPTASVTSSQLYNSFYITMEEILLYLNSGEIKDKFFEKGNILYSFIIFIMIFVTFWMINYIPLKELNYLGNIFFVFLFCGIGFFVLFASMFELIKMTKYFGIAWGSLFGGISWSIMLLPQLIQKPVYILAYIIGLICIFLLLTINKHMVKRSAYGNELYGKIKGFKRFLSIAKKEELEALVMKNPTYFYDILPYAYVLGVSDKWIKRFEIISFNPPTWHNNSSYLDYDSFGNFINSTMSSAEMVMSSNPSKGSSGGGSSGSSSGGSSGGGSSGGGSGGGGGGSW